MDGNNTSQSHSIQSLLHPENRVLRRLGDAEFNHGFGWKPDLLLGLGIKTRACLPLLFDQLAKAGQNEFAVLFGRFVSEGGKRPLMGCLSAGHGSRTGENPRTKR
jgi:hypothetical protein